jgi:hypothetical protein
MVLAFGVVALAWAIGATPVPVFGRCMFDWKPGYPVQGLTGPAYATAVYDDGTGPALYVAGSFTVAGNAVANGIARWNGMSWLPLGSGMNNTVNASTVCNGDLVVGGSFITAGTGVSAYWARWGPVSTSDGDIDGDDYIAFAACFNGTGNVPACR